MIKNIKAKFMPVSDIIIAENDGMKLKNREEKLEKKSYYAIIPANVRYDKRLTANAKLLYGEITALCNEKGFCWATNKYFAELYEVSKETVSRWISKLQELKYIETVMKYKNKQIIERRIYLKNEAPIDQNINRYDQNDQEGIDQNINNPIDQNVKENNTGYNTTYNNTVEEPESEITNKKEFASAIIKCMAAVNKQPFADIKAEFIITHKVINRAMKLVDNDLQSAVILMRSMLKKLHILRKGNSFWAGQPYTPRTLWSKRIWEMIVGEMQKDSKEEEKEMENEKIMEEVFNGV